jgi:hypothetical protein
MVRDLESSDFHWLKNPDGSWKLNEDGSKIINPLWPKNYINEIKALERSGMYRVVFVSSHDDIRREMAEVGIRYSNLFPTNTPEMKKIMMERYRLRQSPPEFINNLEKNWDSYINSLMNDSKSIKNVQLNPQSINMWHAWILME